MTIFDYWFILDWLAVEWVEDLGSVVAGFLVFCPLIVLSMTVWLPVMLTNKKAGLWTLAIIAVLAGVIWVGVTFQVHDVWNEYQRWYTTPLAPRLSG